MWQIAREPTASTDGSSTVPASPVPVRLLRPMSLAVVAAAAAAALTIAPAPAPATSLAGDCTPDASWKPARTDLANAVIKLVNAHRASLGLRQLAVSPTLTRSAVWKARHMATYRYMAHDDPAPPVARSVGERIAACGYSGAWGENIAEGYPTAASVVAGWLGSPGHKANIENPSYTVTGSGAAIATGGITLWAQDFGTSNDSGSRPSGGSGSGEATQGIVLRNLRLAPRRPRAGGRRPRVPRRRRDVHLAGGGQPARLGDDRRVERRARGDGVVQDVPALGGPEARQKISAHHGSAAVRKSASARSTAPGRSSSSRSARARSTKRKPPR